MVWQRHVGLDAKVKVPALLDPAETANGAATAAATRDRPTVNLGAGRYEKPMKNFLNQFMDKHRHDSEEELAEHAQVFTATAQAVRVSLGASPFHIRAGLNAAVFDCVFTAFAHHLDKLPADLEDRYKELTKSDAFLQLVSSNTTDKEVVGRRLALASSMLFG